MESILLGIIFLSVIIYGLLLAWESLQEKQTMWEKQNPERKLFKFKWFD